MHKFAAAAATGFLSAMLVTPALAQSSAGGSASASADAAASVDLACMSAAIETRENAVINARTTYNASIMPALTTRRDALKAAFMISNNADRRVAMNAAWDAFMKVVVTARATYKTNVTAAWKAFVEASVNCKVAPDRPVRFIRERLDRDDDNDRDEDKDNGREDREERTNRGLHLGWLKKAKHEGTLRTGTEIQGKANMGKADVNASVKLDLSY